MLLHSHNTAQHSTAQQPRRNGVFFHLVVAVIFCLLALELFLGFMQCTWTRSASLSHANTQRLIPRPHPILFLVGRHNPRKITEIRPGMITASWLCTSLSHCCFYGPRMNVEDFP